MSFGIYTHNSIDTIGEISLQEISLVTSSSPRSAFEQQLCSQLLRLSEVAETLADRVMALEARLVEVEAQQLEHPKEVAISDEAGELLLESEEKVRLLRDRLSTREPIVDQAEESFDQDVVTDDVGNEDVEYIDDPQTDLMTA